MPYIKPEDREQYDVLIDALLNLIMEKTSNNGKSSLEDMTNAIKGHHNYIMFVLAVRMSNKLGIRYHTLQDIVGTFECCKAEFLRRVVDPYEDQAIAKNGDIDDLVRNK
jgi:hypothetical protein